MAAVGKSVLGAAKPVGAVGGAVALLSLYWFASGRGRGGVRRRCTCALGVLCRLHLHRPPCLCIRGGHSAAPRASQAWLVSRRPAEQGRWREAPWVCLRLSRPSAMSRAWLAVLLLALWREGLQYCIGSVLYCRVSSFTVPCSTAP